MALCPRLTAYPPLGKVTVLEPGQTEVRFSALVEWQWNRSLPFQAELLYADAAKKTHPSTWAALPLDMMEDDFPTVRENYEHCRRASFTATVKLSSLIRDHSQESPARIAFTMRYRPTALYPWKLIYAYRGIDTGDIIIPAANSDMVDLNRLLSIADGWAVQSLSSTESSVQTFEISSDRLYPKHEADDTQLETLPLGSICGQVRFMAVIRIEPYWFGCTQDGDFFHLKNDASMICFLTASGHCLCLLALSGDDDFYTVFQSGQDGAVVVGGRNDGPSDAPLKVLAGISRDPHEAIASVMDQAKRVVSGRPKMSDFQAIKTAVKGSDTKDFFDSFGYCTYNGLGLDLTEDKIFSGLDELVKNSVEYNTLIIDDNWQTVGETLLDYANAGWRGWSRFEANSEGFPSGLGSLVREIKRRYPHVKYVGVWHAFLGYWAGLTHGADFGGKYKLRTTKAKVRGNVVTDVIVVDPSDVHRFYDDFYSFLRSCDIDFVKTDVQHMLSMFVNPQDRSDIPSAYQSAWTEAYLRHFDGKAISCMSLVPQITFHSLLQFNTPPVLVRNSDDFFPEIYDSHPFHLFVNAHNALVTQHLNCIPDWDMFQTSHPYSSYHGAARCISGGPVLITDVPGQHSKELINAMTAATPRGGRIALRPHVAVTVDVWDNFADGQILKIRSSTQSSAALMGVFNVANGQKDAFIPLDQFFPRSQAPTRCLMRSYRTGQIFMPRGGVSDLFHLQLETRGWDILSVFPMDIVELQSGLGFACLGLLDKMSGAAAVVSCKVVVADLKVQVCLKALGKAGFYLEGGLDLDRVLCDGQEVQSAYIGAEEQRGGATLVTIDLEAHWNDHKLTSQEDVFTVTFSLKKC
ncbi:raffinose synthase or seed imbibition protein sip1 domain-containing protein [Sarocladium implicatum]|nr:raffinose synthase or seed imbibition protein sip1 domain-containing protein [Sarocladium implicatum]